MTTGKSFYTVLSKSNKYGAQWSNTRIGNTTQAWKLGKAWTLHKLKVDKGGNGAPEETWGSEIKEDGQAVKPLLLNAKTAERHDNCMTMTDTA